MIEEDRGTLLLSIDEKVELVQLGVKANRENKRIQSGYFLCLPNIVFSREQFTQNHIHFVDVGLLNLVLSKSREHISFKRLYCFTL